MDSSVHELNSEQNRFRLFLKAFLFHLKSNKEAFMKQRGSYEFHYFHYEHASCILLGFRDTTSQISGLTTRR